jgi:hypothetical protein
MMHQVIAEKKGAPFDAKISNPDAVIKVALRAAKERVPAFMLLNYAD